MPHRCRLGWRTSRTTARAPSSPLTEDRLALSPGAGRSPEIARRKGRGSRLWSAVASALAASGGLRGLRQRADMIEAAGTGVAALDRPLSSVGRAQPW